MNNKPAVTTLCTVIVLLAIVAAATGVFSSEGSGQYIIETVRGDSVTVYGKGIYKHMSADVAPQGIAQDYVTLFVGVPLLIVGLIWARKNLLKGRFMLAGVLAYFLVTYLFYLAMGMYNVLFLVYVLLLGASFFALSLTLFSFNIPKLSHSFGAFVPRKLIGGFLIFSSVMIAFLWLGVVIPPLLEGSIIPEEVEHYTTLIVQGLDLALLLPLAFLAGWLFIQEKPLGYLLAPVYVIFLSILMAALTAKIIAMGILGQNIMPAIIIIPLFTLAAISCSVLIIRNIKEPSHT
jgi:hypothetical protein